MNKQKSKLQTKLEQRAMVEAACRKALAETKRQVQSQKMSGAKRKDAEFLARWLAVPMDHPNRIRLPEDFEAKTYNLQRQLLALLDHLFVSYPAPHFLYRAMLNEAGQAIVFPGEPYFEPSEWEQKLFIAAAQGQSIYKTLDGRLTRKEAHVFLSGPDDNFIEENIVWAQFRAAGVNEKLSQNLMEWLCDSNVPHRMGERFRDLINFVVREEAQLVHWGTYTFAQACIQLADSKTFRFQDRSLMGIWRFNRYDFRAWEDPSKFKTLKWQHSHRAWTLESKEGKVTATELNSHRQLLEESDAMYHCVSAYDTHCQSGECQIISFRWHERVDGRDRITKRITAEFYPKERRLIQIKGKCNREPTPEEMKVIRRWAEDHNVHL